MLRRAEWTVAPVRRDAVTYCFLRVRVAAPACSWTATLVEEPCEVGASRGRLGARRAPTSDENSAERGMTRKNNFKQQQLWLPVSRDNALELPAGKRRELSAALADLLLQYASAAAESEPTVEEAGYDNNQTAGDQDNA